MSTGAICTIISGTPGAGKTALAVSMLLEELQRNPARPVFVMGIPELAVPHEVVPPVEQWTTEKPHPDDPSITYPEFTFPDGALIIIDEAQNAFRPLSQGAKVPPHVAAMERHRHKGLDFWLITQHPTMLHSNVRRLVGKHLHLRSLWSGGQLLEWPEAADPNSTSERGRASVQRYAPPKKVFALYKSSSMHVKRSRRLPMAVYLFGAAALAAAVLVYRGYDRVSTAIAGEAPPIVSDRISDSRPPWEKGASASASSPSGAGPSGASGVTVTDYVPRISTRPETAPMYDSIRQVRALPVVAGCIAMAERCTCYTSQATDAFLTVEQCREWLRSPPFDPFREHARPDPVAPQPDGRAS
jgi:zona occludens toxin